MKIGDRVRKKSGSAWTGIIVGTYSTALTPEGFAVESETEKGSVQIYPAAALEKLEPREDEAANFGLYVDGYTLASTHKIGEIQITAMDGRRVVVASRRLTDWIERRLEPNPD